MMQHQDDLASSAPRSHALLLAAIIAAIAIGVAALLVDARTLLLVVAVIGVGVIGVRYPFAAVWAYLFVAVLRPEEFGPPDKVLRLQLVLAIYCVVALFVLPTLFGYPLRLRFSVIDATTLPLFVVPFLIAPAAFWRTLALRSAYDFAKNGFGYAIARVYARTLRQIKLLLWCFALATGTMAVLGLHRWATGKLVVGEGGILRLAGVGTSFGDANSLANVLVTGLPMLACLYWISRSRLSRLLLIGLAAVHAATVSLTGSRSAALSLLAAALVIAWRSPRRMRTVVAVALGLVTIWILSPASLRGRYLSVGHYWREATYLQRAESRRAGWLMLRDHPLTGVGLGCFKDARRSEYDGVWLNAHNVYAQVLGETGLLGGFAFLLYIGGIFYGIRTLRRRLRAHAGAPHHDDLRHIANAIEALMIVLLIQGMAAHNLLRFVYFPLPALLVAMLALVESPGESAAAPESSPPAPAESSWHRRSD
jgi:O-antigen ligase